MLAGIRTQDLRKVYTSAPPPAAGAGGFGSASPRAKGKQPKPQIVALDGISLNVRPGEIFCLLGPNGAGKSTTAGILTTRVRPTSGQAWIGEFDVWKNQVAVKRLIGVVAQRPNLDFSLTAREILLFHGAYFGIDSHERAKRAARSAIVATRRIVCEPAARGPRSAAMGARTHRQRADPARGNSDRRRLTGGVG